MNLVPKRSWSAAGLLSTLSLWLVSPAHAAKLPDTDQRAGPPKTLNTLRTFPEIQSQKEWQARAKDIREHILVSCGLWPLPDVDAKRLGCAGASGGGTHTFMLGAIDDRLAAQAPCVMVSHSMQRGCPKKPWRSGWRGVNGQ